MKIHYYGDRIYCIGITTGRAEWLIQLEDAINLHKQLGTILDAVARAKAAPLTTHSSRAVDVCALWNSCKLKLSEGGCLPNCAKRMPPA